jgi:hypothetical protein
MKLTSWFSVLASLTSTSIFTFASASSLHEDALGSPIRSANNTSTNGYGARCNERRMKFDLRDYEDFHHCWRRLIGLGTESCKINGGRRAEFCQYKRMYVSGRYWSEDGIDRGNLSVSCKIVGQALLTLSATWR